MPRAEDGHTMVFLPQQMPEVVLKHSGREEAIKRFHEMQEVRSILDSQKSCHLVIPQANLYEDFLVEKRLPINVDSYANMELYLSNPTRFDEPVRELTRLFSKIYIRKLVIQVRNPLGHIHGVEDFVCYDNLPLYLVEKNEKIEGRIGLIDLEDFENSPSPQGLETLVRIFPLHLEIVKEEASKLKMEFNEGVLEAAAEKGKIYLQVGFTDHLRWLEQKNVDFNNISSQPFQVSQEREKELTTILEQELLKLNQGVSDLHTGWEEYLQTKDFITENPEAVAKDLAAIILPLIITRINSLIKRHQNRQLSKLLGQKTTKAQLISFRSVEINRSQFYQDIDEALSEHEKIKFKSEYPSRESTNISEQLACLILKNLVKGGEIFYFDPGHYSFRHRDRCWVRF